MKEKRREIEMKRNERKDDFFEKKKNVSGPSNPPDELAQNVSKKITVGRIIPPFFCNSSESGRFSIIYMIRIRFFGPGELNQKGVTGGTVLRSQHDVQEDSAETDVLRLSKRERKTN